MTDREVLEAVYATIGQQLAPAPVRMTSPTGREPKLIWTPALQTAYNRMWANVSGSDLGGQWAGLILSNANGNRYGDSGLWGTLAYQMTGDPAYVVKAWAKLQPFLTATAFDDNSIREYALERVIILDWLWPGLTQAQRDQFLFQLDLMFQDAFTAASLPGTFPLRNNDSDQVTGVYMGVAAYAAAFGADHPPALEFFSRPFVGGYESTGRDRSTLRNCVRDFVEMAAGGEWIESGEYNLGTVRLLVLGAEAIRTATGVDHFPEVTAWKARAATRYRHFLTPDLKQSFQWGDDQEPHAIRVGYWASTAMLFDDPDARQLVYDLVAHYGAIGIYTAEPLAPKGFLKFDPYGPVRPSSEMPMLFDACAGQGLVTARSGWTADASQLMVHVPSSHPSGYVDHTVSYCNDVQFYRKGGWALTHPITYGGPSVLGPGCNTMLHCGFGGPVEYKGHPTVTRRPDGLMVSGTAGGSMLPVPGNYYNIPTFLHEYSRVILWVPGAVDTLMIFDRSHVDDPQLLSSFTRYSAAQQKQIKANPLRQWLWHLPVVPTLLGHTAEWPIPSGMARLTWYRDDLVPTVVDQKVAWATTNMAGTEKKFHLSLTPTVNAPGFQTLVTVLEFGDPAKMGQNLVFPLFNTLPGPKLPSPKNNAYDPSVPGLLAGIPV